MRRHTCTSLQHVLPVHMSTAHGHQHQGCPESVHGRRKLCPDLLFATHPTNARCEAGLSCMQTRIQPSLDAAFTHRIVRLILSRL